MIDVPTRVIIPFTAAASPVAVAADWLVAGMQSLARALASTVPAGLTGGRDAVRGQSLGVVGAPPGSRMASWPRL